MNPLFIGPLFDMAKSLLERWFPDPAKKAEAEAAWLQMIQEQEFKKIVAQLEVNAKEAMNPNLFVAGWRPFVGWCCGLGFLYSTIGQPFLVWLAAVKGFSPPPDVDKDLLLTVLGGMLGLGILRTTEKVKGVTK
jgi:hypothetical protein